jgi:hypothetical protein
MVQYINDNKKLLGITLMSLALVLFSSAPFTLYAQEDGNNGNANDAKEEKVKEDKKDEPKKNTEDDSPIVAPLVTQFIGTPDDEPETAAQPAATSTEATSSPAPVDSKNSSQATSTPTTPAEQREKQSEKDVPKNDPEYNQTVETILNQYIPPAPVVEEPKKVTPKKSTKSTTTAATTTSETATSTNEKQATTTPAVTGTTNSTINGNSNQFAPSNYYIPFDKLSPELTYGLSALAMVLGIVGAVLILKEPRTQEELVWSPQFSERSLQES